MKLIDRLKPLLPHLGIVLLFIVLSFAYFSPILEGKELPQMDHIHAKGMAQELVEFEEQHPGEESQWTNSMFGGMPAYQIKGGTSYNIFLYMQRFLRLGLPFTTVSVLFIYLLGFYVLLLSFKMDKWLAVVGAIAFALGSYNLIIVAAGHITKTYAIAYMAPVIAGTIWLYRKKYLWGFIFTLIALGIQVSTNHVQITYYLGLMVALLVVFELVSAIKEKAIAHWGKATALLVLATMLAVLPEARNLLTTYEYGKESIRGPSELTPASDEKASDGLDKGYAMAWSYGISESFTLLVPDFKGGASGYLGENEELMKNVDPQFQQIIGQQSHYWGEQPFTSGPVYAGAIVCFLFLLGFVFVSDKLKWWILSVSVLSLLLAWGSHAGMFTDFMFYYFPLYNKFRTVAMALVIASFAIPFLAALFLREMHADPTIIQRKKKEFLIVLGSLVGLLLIFLAVPSIFEFMTSQEMQSLNEQKTQSPQYAAQIDQFIAGITDVRISIFRTDVLRSIVFILLGAAVLWFWSTKSLKYVWAVSILALLIVSDMWSVDKRYLNNDNFVSKRSNKDLVITRADEYIKKDSDLDYRVLNLTRSTFNDAVTPFHHKSIGGYHGAKLRRYQELIDYHISPEINRIRNAFQQDSADVALQNTLPYLPVLNMLNTKYFIIDPQGFPIINMYHMGNAWFVDEYKIVENADEEIESLQGFNPYTTAIVDKRFADLLASVPEVIESPDSARRGQIKLIEYKPNHLTYQVNSVAEQLAVFSEIYYDKGWNAYLDGKPVDHLRVNYVLRAMVLPKGPHMVEFKFEPQLYKTGQTVSMAGSVIVVLLLLFALYTGTKNMPEITESPKTEKISTPQSSKKQTRK